MISDNTCPICQAGFPTRRVNHQFLHGSIGTPRHRARRVAVIGESAVGLTGVLAANELGAARIIVVSRHEDRQKLGREFGATDIVAERGDDAIARIRDMTDGLGAHSVIEAVATCRIS